MTGSFAALAPSEQALLEAAAAWHERLRADPATRTSSDYLDWAANPDNSRALQAVDEGWSAVDDVAAAPEMLALRQAALRRAREARLRQWRPRLAVVRAIAAALLVSILGSGGYYLLWPWTTYRTDVGERRIVALPDGSRISLDSDTDISVHYSKTARTLTLDRGRARFDVAHDVTRPFAVTAGTETVVAVGTSFDVEKLGTKVLVTLLQGHVVIKSATATMSPVAAKRVVALSAGEQLIATRLNPRPVIAPANVQLATAWEAGHLIFKDETLLEAVARVNRYTERPIVVDPSLASLRVSGVFNAGDVSSFVSAVTSYFAVEATTTGDNNILLQRRS